MMLSQIQRPFTTFSSVLAMNTTKSTQTSFADVIFGSQQECKLSHVVSCVWKKEQMCEEVSFEPLGVFSHHHLHVLDESLACLE